MNQEDLHAQLEYYKSLYKREMKKSKELTEQLVAAEQKAADAQFHLDNIHNSKIWRMVYPFRLAWSHFKNLFIRIKRYPNLKSFIKKVKSKMIERKAYEMYGTGSFPTEEVRKGQRDTLFSKDITFSILVPLYNTPESFLREMIESVLEQTYENWELCLGDGSDKEHEEVGRICCQYRDNDSYRGASRIKYKKIEKNLGISGNTNICYQLAKGEYIGLFDHDDILHPCVLYEYMKVICDQNADYIYCDETTFQGNSINDMVTMHFKPDFAIDNLRANNYICHFSVFSSKLLEGKELFRSKFDGSQDHDMVLRLTAEAKNIVHVPKMLYYWRSHAGSVASDIQAKSYAIDAAKGAVAAHLTSSGFQNFKIESSRAFETIFRIRYAILGNPKISIMIPNKDHREELERCINSILEKSSYDNYEILVLENNSEEEETFVYYEQIEKNPRIQVLHWKKEFNYSAVNNMGEKEAKGEYLILLNNDTEVVTRNWIEELLMYAQRKDVGAVGCMLYYGNYAIQHAGIVLGLGAHRTAGHTHYKMGKDNLGYMGRLCYAQNVTAVTGACMMVSKKQYEEVGGLDEEFKVALNDVDFCLKLREKGYLNIFTPFAELFHYESQSRGRDDDSANKTNGERYEKECARFREKWKKHLEKGDPYFNVNFSLDYSNYVIGGGEHVKSMV